MSRIKVAGFIIIILIAANIRIISVRPETPLSGDANLRYLPLARHLLAGHGFSRSSNPPYLPDDFDQPGYPFFIAAIYSLVPESPQSLAIVQLFLELATLAVTVLIARCLGFSRRVQITALTLGLISPFLPIFTGKILTEVLATFLVTLTCFFLIRAVSRGSAVWWVCAGTFSSLCLLVRPDLVLAVILMVITAGILSARQQWQQAMLKLCILIVAASTVLLPWVIRNYLNFNSPRPLGGVASQVNSAYTRWLDTWMDDPKYLPTVWWGALDPNSVPEFPNYMSSDERQKAEDALQLAKKQGSFNGQPEAEFATLALLAKNERPFSSTIGVRLRRLIKTVLRMPSYISSTPIKFLAYLFWIAFIGTVIIGSLRMIWLNNPVVFLLLALLLGRLVLPLISAIAIEPRYILESLPIGFVLASLALTNGKLSLNNYLGERQKP